VKITKEDSPLWAADRLPGYAGSRSVYRMRARGAKVTDIVVLVVQPMTA
jgi:Translation initiation factor 2 (IF-2; GTPase)